MIKRAAIATLAFLIALPSLYWLLSEAAVMFEMASTGAKSRAELADDFGLGIIGLFVVVPATVIGAVTIASFICWKMRPRRRY
ncbi:hypothetical protein [Pseudomonas syringae]|uniref:Uncharacterized protein n=1 Tax=Pseudomonas syringae pv. syringae TaxID=321 RepID=A0A1S6YBC7_PSESY|nr:hypothetical protein [Pseudomonas syringae]ALE01125.1 hypothetical protein PSYRMG_25990 [Pseudomonas syringae UMAF0158]AQX42064.1 hypothetical protein [Pseudomonas syringae pv. syringae]AQX42129.1 hypothetical protein [Pseudomonas syringae pv. syringae]MCK9694750.1 hypothetical protein [Pseudomonas syringae pv. syringae]MCK9709712.1 hypothetical protein [Pseudomonas syringae pv. syringae]